MGKQEALKAIGQRLILPTLPEVVARINAMIPDPSCGPQEIGRVVASDPALTARVLSIANSSFFGLQEPVLSAEQAATVIGVRSLRNIAMQVTVIQRYEHLAGVEGFELGKLWEHASETAQLCQLIGTASAVHMNLAADEFFTCGLLHDVGKVVLLESLGDEYVEVLMAARSEGASLHKHEERALGFTHVDVGVLMATRWKLPASVGLAIEHHHGPRERIVDHPVVAVVAVADQISYRLGCADFPAALERLEGVAGKILKITPNELERIVDSIPRAAGALKAA